MEKARTISNEKVQIAASRPVESEKNITISNEMIGRLKEAGTISGEKLGHSELSIPWINQEVSFVDQNRARMKRAAELNIGTDLYGQEVDLSK